MPRKFLRAPMTPLLISWTTTGMRSPAAAARGLESFATARSGRRLLVSFAPASGAPKSSATKHKPVTAAARIAFMREEFVAEALGAGALRGRRRRSGSLTRDEVDQRGPA